MRAIQQYDLKNSDSLVMGRISLRMGNAVVKTIFRLRLEKLRQILKTKIKTPIKFRKKDLRNNLVTYIFVTEWLHNVNTIEMQRDVFQAIADPTRREIIDLLAEKSLPVNEVAGNFDISRPAVSKHIKILKECGLVVIRKEGRKRFCRADPRKLQEVAEWAARYRKFWSKKLDELEILLEEEDKNKK